MFSINSCRAESVYVAYVLVVSDQANTITQHDTHTTADDCFHWDCVAGSAEASATARCAEKI